MAPPPKALIDRSGPVMVITFNRPERMNAVDAETATIIGDALEAAHEDPEVRAVVVTGAGTKAFCAGADLKAAAAGEPVTPEERRAWGFAGLVSHFIAKPVIAAVNGFALAGGAEVVLACDLAVAGRSARFGFTEIKWGLVASAGGAIRLPRLVPRKVALEMLWFGEQFGVDEAQRWGIVNRVVDDDQVFDEAMRLAERLAESAPLAVEYTKRLVDRRYDDDSEPEREEWARTVATHKFLRASHDGQEGPRAFSEGRPPRWTGR
jgi:crotonobetainyl-CoA hydratase